MLPQAIPNSRILRFGYESQWLGKEAIQQRLPLVADQLLRNLMASRKVWRNVLFPQTGIENSLRSVRCDQSYSLGIVLVV